MRLWKVELFSHAELFIAGELLKIWRTVQKRPNIKTYDNMSSYGAIVVAKVVAAMATISRMQILEVMMT